MPTEVPYMASNTNIPAILDKIRTAGTPPKFTHEFLKSTLGFASSNDRALVKVLRQLGFLSSDGTPTQRYNEFRGDNPGQAIAVGLREGWPDFFLADERIFELSSAQIQGIAKSLTGAGDAVAQKMASTFKALCDKADWSDIAADRTRTKGIHPNNGPETGRAPDDARPGDSAISGERGISNSGLFQLHHDIHLHLPPTTDVSVYRAIFKAIKAELM